MIFIIRYSEKIAKLSDHVYQIAEDAIKTSEDELNVINHGDCHLNNMLFKYDNDGKPIDQIFVSTITFLCISDCRFSLAQRCIPVYVFTTF